MSEMNASNTTQKRIIFFDGICHLCNGFVDFVISRDKKHLYQFAPLQGETAKALLPENLRTELSSVIYLENDNIKQQSTAVISIMIGLGFPYHFCYIFYFVPARLRDFIYKWVANNRYTWFGQRETCRLPQAEERQYLLP